MRGGSRFLDPLPDRRLTRLPERSLLNQPPMVACAPLALAEGRRSKAVEVRVGPGFDRFVDDVGKHRLPAVHLLVFDLNQAERLQYFSKSGCTLL
jgi:hypothetical protein